MAREHDIYFNGDDEFDAAVDLARDIRRGGGDGGSKVENAWEALSAGRTVGRTIDLAAGATQFASTQAILEVSAKDNHALQLGVCIAPPNLNIGGNTQPVSNVEFGFIAQMAPAPLAATAIRFPLSQAVIEWGMGGSRCVAYVDINNGCAVNLMATQFVRVSVQLLTAPVPASLIRYSAFVGPGLPRSGARKSFAVASGVGVETTAFAIPPFASKVMMMGSEAAGTIRFYDGKTAAGAGAGFRGEVLYSQNVSNCLPVPIPEGCMFWSVLPQTANDVISVVFDLAI